MEDLEQESQKIEITPTWKHKVPFTGVSSLISDLEDQGIKEPDQAENFLSGESLDYVVKTFKYQIALRKAAIIGILLTGAYLMAKKQ